LLGIGVIATLVIGWQVAAFAGVIGEAQGFEDDDGNLVDNTTAGIDWNSFARVDWLPSPSATPDREADKTLGSFTFKGIEDWQATTADSGFAGGTKQDADCANVISAKAPNKDDLKRIYLATTTGSNGHTYLDLAWVRIPQNTTSASAHVAFEFNKGETSCNEPGGLVVRTPGDMLVVYDFEGGATDVPTITLRRWLTDPDDPDQEDFFTDPNSPCDVDSNSPTPNGCWGDAVNLTATGFAEAKVFVAPTKNGTTLDQLAPPALTSTTGTSVDANLGDREFGEAGIDLTGAGVFEEGVCNSFGTAYGVSRSSGNSGTAQMKDLVGPAPFTLQNCGTVTIIKQTDPRGLEGDFPFTSTLAGNELSCTQDTVEGSGDSAAEFTLTDAGNEGKELDSTDPDENSDDNTQTCSNVPATTGDPYTVTEGDDLEGFTFRDATCTASGTGTEVEVDGKVASITMAGGGSVTCLYVNVQNKQSILETDQGFVPQDTATITGTGLKFDGTVTFQLIKGTLGDVDGETCDTPADPPDEVVYEETVANADLVNGTASTDNSGDPNVNGGFTILEADAGSYYWKVSYNGDTDPDVTSCNEVSTLTIDDGEAVSNPPTL
jgi:hypothetical protein